MSDNNNNNAEGVPEYPVVHTIDIPASILHRLDAGQRDELEAYAKAHPDARKFIVCIEHQMEENKLSFAAALAQAKKEHPGQEEGK